MTLVSPLGAAVAELANDSAVKAYCGGRNPVGMRVELPRPTGTQSYEIVGVVRDTKHLSLRADAPRFIYLSSRQPRRPHARRPRPRAPPGPGTGSTR